MFARSLVRLLLIFIPFWWINIVEEEGGRLITIHRTLWRKGHDDYHFGKAHCSLSEMVKKGYCMTDDTITLLWVENAGNAGACILTPLPLGIEEYLEEYAIDRESIRNTPYYDPDFEGFVHLPSLDYQKVWTLVDREHVEGWFGGSRFRKLMMLLMIAMIVIGGMAVGLTYEGATPHIVRDCFDTHGYTNSTLWSPVPCITSAVTHSNSTSSSSTSLYSTGALG